MKQGRVLRRQGAVVTGVDLIRNLKSGQAMIEFLLGLVGIMVIVLGMELISSVVVRDFSVMCYARGEVALALVNGFDGSAGSPDSQSYGVSSLFLDDIQYDRMKDLQSTYPPRFEDVNGFDVLAEGDPLSDMVGVVVPVSVPVESEFLRNALGRDSVRKINAVWMPPWDDLMGEEEQ